MAAAAVQKNHSSRGADILDLPTLVTGGKMTQQEITDAIGRDFNVVREDIYNLVTSAELERICGIGSSPAYYCLPNFRHRHLGGFR